MSCFAKGFSIEIDPAPSYYPKSELQDRKGGKHSRTVLDHWWESEHPDLRISAPENQHIHIMGGSP
jgi:hypothetical protein